MINETEIRKLLADKESDRIERTVSTTDTDKFAIAICAFANDMPDHRKPGYLVIGVDDVTGKPVGIRVTDKLLINLSNIRSQGNILPIPAMNIEKFVIDDKEIAVVEVIPSDTPPVRYQGRICIRVGPRRAFASEQEERILSERREARSTTFDASPVGESKLEDISLSLFSAYRQNVVNSEIIAANNRSIEEQLASLRFFDLKRKCLTAAGILLFGKNPRFFFPGAYIQYLEFSGTAATEPPLDQAEISGDLMTVLRELDTRINSVVRTGMSPDTALREKLTTNYPTIALREFILNAIMHKDYRSNTPVRFYRFADKIEIQNPGGLYGEVTRETLTKRSSYRNPVLAEAMKSLGYVNRFGYGIQAATASLEKNGSLPPQFEIDAQTFLVTVCGRKA